MLVVVATENEVELAKSLFPNTKIFITGVGGTNVIRSMNRLNKNIEIVNVGYAGSNTIPIGTKVEVGMCSLWHPNVSYDEEVFKLNENADYYCYTSNDFVLQCDEKDKHLVFDMELAFICSLGFRKVTSIKVISDNLSLNEYERTIEDGKTEN